MSWETKMDETNPIVSMSWSTPILLMILGAVMLAVSVSWQLPSPEVAAEPEPAPTGWRVGLNDQHMIMVPKDEMMEWARVWRFARIVSITPVTGKNGATEAFLIVCSLPPGKHVISISPEEPPR
jgi:hypothetical protein